MKRMLTGKKIQERSRLSFHNTYSFLKKIDQLPTGPDWVCQMVTVEGDRIGEDGKNMTEEVELWRRDPLECIQELIGNPAFAEDIAYEPEMVFADAAGENRIVDEAWTADWWWETQVRRPLTCQINLNTDVHIPRGRFPKEELLRPSSSHQIRPTLPVSAVINRRGLCI
jgi:hypothetical protein